MSDRKKELKKWFVDHPDVTITGLAERYGKTVSVAHGYLFTLPSAPAAFIKVCRGAGIPEDLLPSRTKTKAELLAENEKLRAQNAELQAQVVGM